MNMKTTVTITKFSDDFGDLKNMKPAGFGTSQVPEGEMTFDNGVPMQDPATEKDRALWNRMFLALHDVPMPTATDWGLSLLLVQDPGEAGQYHIEYGYPSKTATPRNFSITGDGEAPAVLYDGSQDVVLELTNLVAEKWKTARTISLTGNATGSTSWDGSANASIAVTVNQAANAATADFATNAGQAALANHALTADNATNAANADTADFATNAGNAATATNATNATNAVNANTANGLNNGAITVTLTGDVTGSASISGGVVTIPTTAVGGGGGTGGSGQTEFGNSTQIWGNGTTIATAGPDTGDLVITFPTAFVNASAYSGTFTPQVEYNSSVETTVYQLFIKARTASSITLHLRAISGSSNPAGGVRIDYIIVGQTTP